MRDKDIITQLRQVDEESSIKLGETYHGLSDEDHARLIQKIGQRLHSADETAIHQVEGVTVQNSRFTWVRSVTATAACLLLLAGTVTGAVIFQKRLPATQHPIDATEDAGALIGSSGIVQAQSHTVGERYAATNLTSEGTLWLSVKEIAYEGELTHVTLALASEQAVFYGQPEQFMADNFLAIYQTTDGQKRIAPCAIQVTGTQTGDMPNSVILPAGASCTLELWYRIDESAASWMLVSGTSPALPYTDIRMEESK